MAPRLTHIDAHGDAHMVDVTGKAATERRAVARCVVRTNVRLDDPPMAEAQVAAVLAAHQTAKLIPLCHPIQLEQIDVDIEQIADGFAIQSVAEIDERTGVEMEALTACAFAALTLVSSLLAFDVNASVEELTIWRKSGGRSGTWQRAPDGDISHEPAP